MVCGAAHGSVAASRTSVTSGVACSSGQVLSSGCGQQQQKQGRRTHAHTVWRWRGGRDDKQAELQRTTGILGSSVELGGETRGG